MESEIKLINQALQKAAESCESQDFDIAESFCRQILKVDDKIDEAWFLLGIACFRNNKKEEAVHALDVAAQLTKQENKSHVLSMKEKILHDIQKSQTLHS